MIVRIRSSRRRGRLWHFSRLLLLLFGLGALGYTGWFYFDQYWHQYRTSRAFDKARAGLVAQLVSRPVAGTPPDSAQALPARLTIARLHLTTMIEEGVGERTLRRLGVTAVKIRPRLLTRTGGATTPDLPEPPGR